MKETKKYDYLDALRGIAIFLVLLSHVHYIGVSLSDKFSVGLIGVPLFFMVSAYTLALSQASKGFDFGWTKIFFARRIFRIFPLFLFVILITYILGVMGVFSHLEALKDGIFTFPNLLAHITFTYGFFVDGMNTFRLGEWSLFNEAIFYLLFAFIAPFLIRSFKISLYALAAALCIYGGWNIVGILLQTYHIVNYPEWFTYIYHFPLYHRIDFSLGFVLFHVHKKYFSLSLSSWKQYLLSFLFLFLASGLGFAYAKGIYVNHILRLLLFFFLVFALGRGLPVLKLLTNNIFVYLGKISYSVYLLNLPILSLLGYYLPMSWNPFFRVAVTLSVLVGLCSITYRYELYWINKGTAFIKRYLDK